MIDPITQLILEAEKEKNLDTILEGYDLKCQQCGRVIKIIKDGQGPLSCCNNRMFVMGSNPIDPTDDLDESEEVIEGDSELLQSMQAFEECDADFSPYNQAEVQNKVEKERESRGKKKVSEVRKELIGQIIDPDFQVPIKNVNFTPYNQPETQKEREGERKERERARSGRVPK